MSESKIFDPKSLDDLLAKVQAATGANRWIDADLAALFSQVPERFHKRSERQPELWSDGGPGLNARTWTAPHYSQSIDAALALVEKVLPALVWTIEHGACWLRILSDNDDGVAEFQGQGATTPLAILAALLSSLKAST